MVEVGAGKARGADGAGGDAARHRRALREGILFKADQIYYATVKPESNLMQ